MNRALLGFFVFTEKIEFNKMMMTKEPEPDLRLGCTFRLEYV